MDTTEDRAKCTKQSVRIARRSAKFLLSPEETVRSIAKNAIQNGKKAAVKRDSIGAGINLLLLGKEEAELC